MSGLTALVHGFMSGEVKKIWKEWELCVHWEEKWLFLKCKEAGIKTGIPFQKREENLSANLCYR